MAQTASILCAYLADAIQDDVACGKKTEGFLCGKKCVEGQDYGTTLGLAFGVKVTGRG